MFGVSEAYDLTPSRSGRIRSETRVRARGLAEIGVIGAVVLAAWALLTYFLWADMYRHSDTAALVYLTESTGAYGVPYNQVSISDYDAADVKPLPAARACAAPLIPGPESYPNGRFDHLEYHAYYFAYALAPLTWFMPGEVVIAVTQALAVVATVLLVYLILRLEGVPALARGAFCALVLVYPVVNESLNSSFDLYMDRYFPPLMLAYLVLMYYSLIAPRPGWRRAWLWAVPLGVLAASTNDRSIMYVVAGNVAVAFLMGRRALFEYRRVLLTLLGMSLLLGVALAAYLTWVHTANFNTIGGFAGRVGELIDLFTNPAPFRFGQTYGELSLKFLVMNCLFFGVWGFWRARVMLIAVAAMLPNILTTIGGAEKISWGFHYHADYLPFLLFAAALGFAAASRAARRLAARVALGCSVLAAVTAMFTFIAEQPGWVFNRAGSVDSGLLEVVSFYRARPDSEVTYRRSLYKEVDALIPPGVTVTSPQSFAGFLFPGRHWFYYPIGIDTAEYAVLPMAHTPSGATYFDGAETYRGDGEALNECLTQRLARDGYDVGAARVVGPIAVLHRTP